MLYPKIFRPSFDDWKDNKVKCVAKNALKLAAGACWTVGGGISLALKRELQGLTPENGPLNKLNSTNTNSSNLNPREILRQRVKNVSYK